MSRRTTSFGDFVVVRDFFFIGSFVIRCLIYESLVGLNGFAYVEVMIEEGCQK